MLLKDSNNPKHVFCCNTEGSDKNENENLGDMFANRFQNLLIPLLALAIFLSSFSFGSGDQQQAKHLYSKLCDILESCVCLSLIFRAILVLFTD